MVIRKMSMKLQVSFNYGINIKSFKLNGLKLFLIFLYEKKEMTNLEGIYNSRRRKK